jgi:hypothetical protein
MTRTMFFLTMAAGLLLAVPTTAEAVSPRNPYRTFNLGGVNYGSMRWEQAQRQGRRVWPYNGRYSRSTRRSGPTMTLGGFSGAGGGVIVRQGGRTTSSTTTGTVTRSQQTSR